MSKYRKEVIGVELASAVLTTTWKSVSALRDLLILRGFWIKRRGDGFAFLIHARDITDVKRHMPFLSTKYLPEKWILWITLNCWPLVVSRVKGLKDTNGKGVEGWVITLPMTAGQMMSIKGLRLARKRISQACILAERLGAKMIGLGALTASLTDNGTLLQEELKGKCEVKITTGHAFTAFTAIGTLRETVVKLGDNLSEQTVAIVGAAGSIGSSCRYLLNGSVGRLILIDLPKRVPKLEELVEGTSKVVISTDLKELKGAKYIILATNDIRAFVKSEHLSRGCVIIDDAQPINCRKEEAREARSLLLHVVARTPGINCNFDMGVHGSENNYACLAELMAIVSNKAWDQGTVGPVQNGQVDLVADWASKLGFGVAHFQAFGEPISDSKFRQLRLDSVVQEAVLVAGS